MSIISYVVRIFDFQSRQMSEYFQTMVEADTTVHDLAIEFLLQSNRALSVNEDKVIRVVRGTVSNFTESTEVDAIVRVVADSTGHEIPLDSQISVAENYTVYLSL